jgi:hypothetical protein
VGTQVKGFAQQLAVAHPELAPLIASLGNFDIATPLNAAGNSIVDAFRTDTRNMYAGAITLTQPLYMGGKIKHTQNNTNAEELPRQQHHTECRSILSTDQHIGRYFFVKKKKLAEGYLNLRKT